MRTGLRPFQALCGVATLAGLLVSHSASADNVYGKVTGLKESIQITISGGPEGKSYSVVTNNNGEYSVFLPSGTYEVHSNTSGVECKGNIRSYNYPARQDIDCSR